MSLAYLFESFYLETKRNEYSQYARTISSLVSDATFHYQSDDLQQFLSIAGNFITGTMWIMDRRGLVMESSDNTRSTVFRLTESEVNEVLKGNEVIKTGRVQGFAEPMLAVTVPIAIQDYVLGAVSIYTPLAGITSTFHTIRMLMLYAGIIAILLSTLISYYLSHSISKPLHNMSKAAKLMATGKYDKMVSVKGHDEIAQLASSLNYLSKELKKSEENEKQFIANVSHELKTPLTSMKGFIEGILDGVITEDKNKYLQTVNDEIERLTRLVNDLLDISRMQSCDYKLDKKPIILNNIINSAVSKVALAYPNIDMESVLPDEPVIAMGDEDRIQQVLLNLIHNAIKYTGKNKGIRIKLTKDDDYAKVVVIDEGNGIPQQELSRIWDRFYTVDKSRARLKGGTGLGLSIVKQLVELHGGHVYAESKEGHGCTFSFTIPLAQNIHGLQESVNI